MEESKDTTEPTRVFKKQRLSSTRPDLTLSERLKKFIPSLKLKNETLSVIEDKSKSHAIVIAKKYSLKDIQKDQDYFFKEIDSEDDIFININAANLEVFSQQYYRALYPSHLTGSINPFTKYRVAIEFDQAYEKPLKLYVASKAIDFKKPKNLIYQYSLLRQKGLHAPGIASVSFLAKFIGEIDFKVGNVGLRAYSTDQSSFSHIFTQIDSGCAFAGIPSNPGYSRKEFFAGYINSEELTSHPSTKMNIVNYLQSINAKKHFDPLHQYLLALSEQPDIIKETMVTALRCAMTPRCFNEWMIATHFGQNEDAALLKADIMSYLTAHKRALIESFVDNERFNQFFFSVEAITAGLFRKELFILYHSLQEFIAYSKVKFGDAISDFASRFIDENQASFVVLTSTLPLTLLNTMHDEIISFLFDQKVMDAFHLGLLENVKKIIKQKKHTQQQKVLKADDQETKVAQGALLFQQIQPSLSNSPVIKKIISL